LLLFLLVINDFTDHQTSPAYNRLIDDNRARLSIKNRTEYQPITPSNWAKMTQSDGISRGKDSKKNAERQFQMLKVRQMLHFSTKKRQKYVAKHVFLHLTIFCHQHSFHIKKKS
jgi:hypothetical protein